MSFEWSGRAFMPAAFTMFVPIPRDNRSLSFWIWSQRRWISVASFVGYVREHICRLVWNQHRDSFSQPPLPSPLVNLPHTRLSSHAPRSSLFFYHHSHHLSNPSLFHSTLTAHLFYDSFPCIMHCCRATHPLNCEKEA